MRRKDFSFLLTMVYALFTLLYTWYIAGHPGSFGKNKGDYLFYYLGFLFLDICVFIILQGLLARAGNWGLLLLLPAGIWVGSMLIGWLLSWIIRTHSDGFGMMLVTWIALALSFFAVEWALHSRQKKGGRPVRRKASRPAKRK